VQIYVCKSEGQFCCCHETGLKPGLFILNFFYRISFWFDLGLIHTRHFDTQYCDKKIKRYCDKKTFLRHRFLWNSQGKLFKEHTLIYVLFMHLGLFICQELALANRNRWLKNIFLSQYLFIAILCVKMSRVNKALAFKAKWTGLNTRRTFQMYLIGEDKELFKK